MKWTRVLVAAVLLVVGSQAQCRPVKGTGCPGALAPTCRGTLQIGSKLQFTCISTGRTSVQFLSLGLCTQIPVPLSPPIACTSTDCFFGVDSSWSATVRTGGLPLTMVIPNQASLVGVTLCTQCGEVNLRPCIALSQAVQFTIQR